MARRKKGRPVNGILVLDKPRGITSNAALQKVKWLFQAQKAGHTGSLDPLATGVLPICLGETTKVSHFLLDANKRYKARCILGAVTTTGDSDGDIIESFKIPEYSEDKILSCLKGFIGQQNQTPPMYSALKHNGRPLYEYARQGIHIERKSRQIQIFEIKLLGYYISHDTDTESFIEIEVLCSKGTYIRSLCEDIGQSLGCGAYISSLRRLESGPFKLEESITIDDLVDNFGDFTTLNEDKQRQMDALLLPTDRAIESLPSVSLEQAQFDRITQGQSITATGIKQYQTDEQYFRLYFNNTLIALAILSQDNQLKPKRLLFL